MDSNFPQVVPVALESPGVVASLPLHQLILKVLVRGNLALDLDASASLQSHLAKVEKIYSTVPAQLEPFVAWRGVIYGTVPVSDGAPPVAGLWIRIRNHLKI